LLAGCSFAFCDAERLTLALSGLAGGTGGFEADDGVLTEMVNPRASLAPPVLTDGERERGADSVPGDRNCDFSRSRSFSFSLSYWSAAGWTAW